MQVAKIKITDQGGLHLRRAAKIVQLSKRFLSKIYLCHKCKVADTCSILQVMELAAPCDSEVAVIAEGPDEKEAAKEMSELFSDGAGI